jgi:hypothetical protein
MSKRKKFKPASSPMRDEEAERLLQTLFAQFVDNKISKQHKLEMLERLATECMRQAAALEAELKA